MPQPLKKPHQLSQTPCTIHKLRPQLAAGIGLVASEWVALEGHLVKMLTWGLFTFSKTEGPASPVAETVLRRLESLSARLDIIDSLIETRLPAPLYEKFTKDVRPEIRRRAGERNRVVHGDWRISAGHPNHIVLVEGDLDENPVLYSEKDFEDIAARNHGAVNLIGLFMFEMMHTHTPLPFLGGSPPAKS